MIVWQILKISLHRIKKKKEAVSGLAEDFLFAGQLKSSVTVVLHSPLR